MSDHDNDLCGTGDHDCEAPSDDDLVDVAMALADEENARLHRIIKRVRALTEDPALSVIGVRTLREALDAEQ